MTCDAVGTEDPVATEGFVMTAGAGEVAGAGPETLSVGMIEAAGRDGAGRGIATLSDSTGIDNSGTTDTAGTSGRWVMSARAGAAAGGAGGDAGTAGGPPVLEPGRGAAA